MKRKQRGKPPKDGGLQAAASGELAAQPGAESAMDPLETLWNAVSTAAGKLGRLRPRNREDREDVASDGMVTGFLKRKQDPSYATTGIGGWAKRTSRNLVIKQLRAARIRERDAPLIAYEMEIHRSSYGNPELEFDFNELLALVHRGLATLPPGLGEVWVMRKQEGRQVKDIAKELGISESLAGNRICRAAAMMAEYVELHLKVQTREKPS